MIPLGDFIVSLPLSTPFLYTSTVSVLDEPSIFCMDATTGPLMVDTG
jgi:hypothetical protein